MKWYYYFKKYFGKYMHDEVVFAFGNIKESM